MTFLIIGKAHNDCTKYAFITIRAQVIIDQPFASVHSYDHDLLDL